MKTRILVLVIGLFCVVNGFGQPKLYDVCNYTCGGIGMSGQGPGICSSDDRTGIVYLASFLEYYWSSPNQTMLGKFDSLGHRFFRTSFTDSITNSNYYYSEIIPIIGNGYLLSGIEYNPDTLNIITRITSNGSVMWSKTFNNSDVVTSHIVYNPYSNRFLLYRFNTMDPMIMELDSNGSVTMSLDFPGIDSLISCIVTKDSCYLFTAVSTTELIVLKMDAMGTVQNINAFSFANIISLSSIIQFRDKYIVSLSTNSNTNYFKLICLNSLLQPIWSKSTSDTIGPVKLFNWNNHYFNLITFFTGGKIGTINIDSSGNIIGTHYSGVYGGGVDQFHNSWSRDLSDYGLNAQGIIFLYSLTNIPHLGPPADDVEIIQLDSLGNSCMHDTVITPTFNTFYLSENTISISSSFLMNQTIDYPIFSVTYIDTFQMTNCSRFIGIDEIAKSKDNFMKVYPNPSSNGDYTIEIPNDITTSNDILLTMYDDKGSMVLKQDFTDHRNKTEINLIGKSKGIYFVRLTDGSKSYSGKLIKE